MLTSWGTIVVSKWNGGSGSSTSSLPGAGLQIRPRGSPEISTGARTDRPQHRRPSLVLGRHERRKRLRVQLPGLDSFRAQASLDIGKLYDPAHFAVEAEHDVLRHLRRPGKREPARRNKIG